MVSRKLVSALIISLSVGACDGVPSADGQIARPPTEATASFAPPPECDAPRRTGTAVNCGWRLEPGHTFSVSLVEKRVDFHDAGIKQSEIDVLSTAPESGDFAIGSDYVEELVASRLSRETLTSVTMRHQDRSLNPEGAVECVRYTYQAEDREVPRAPGKLFILRGRGILCNGYDRKTAIIQVVNLDFSERYSEAIGNVPVPDFAAKADAILSSLRMR